MRLPRGEFTKWIGVLEAAPSRTTDGAKREWFLCQNCVTYPLNPPVNTVIYEDMSTRLVVA